ncbi:MAG: hypothetical protein JOY70_03040, partial [Acidisphaera sp.]|nr:hypothetical protein [Acidisphaera sp.]
MPSHHAMAPVAPEPASAVPPRRGLRRLADLLLGKVATLALVALARALGIATFLVLAGGVSPGARPHVLFGLVLANLVVLLLLGASLAGW